MYGISLLKPRLEVGPSDVTCPVRACRCRLPLQPALFRMTPEYRCPIHRIYVSANVFAYEREAENLLWTGEDDLVLLHGGRRLGRDIGLARDNSERAVTWNVFRWLETSGALGELLERWTGRPAIPNEVVYWGYAPERDGTWAPLLRARTAFEEDEHEATEPAVVIVTDDTVFVLDPRLAGAASTPRVPTGWERYEQGAKGWPAAVFSGHVRPFASDKGRFELLRLWLLGTHMAEQVGKAFELLHLVPAWSAAPMLADLASHLVQDGRRKARRVSWEDVHAFVSADHPTARDAEAVVTYLEEKSAGYGPDGVLRRAFALDYAARPESSARSLSGPDSAADAGSNPRSSSTSRTLMT